MNWRILPLQTHSAAMNMALDEAAMDEVRKKESPATIRLYRWKPSAITIGYFQCLLDEVDLNACKTDNINIVRRQTGGGAVYHDNEGEITYSIIAPVEYFDSNVKESYKEIITPIINSLQKLGINAEYRPINDITIDKKKISGNAQVRKSGVLLQHGTILYSVDPEKMFRYLTPDKSKLSDKPFIKSVNQAVTSISQLKQFSREEIEAVLHNAFQQHFQATAGTWTMEEMERAKQLAVDKYNDPSWNEAR